MMLYHATNRDLLSEIGKTGLNAGTYFASKEEVVHYYVETIEDEDSDPVILAVDMEQLDKSSLESDFEGIWEPITSAVGMSEEKIQEAWYDSAQGWSDSLSIIGSVRYLAVVHPGRISVVADSYDSLPTAKLEKLARYLDRDSSPSPF